MKKAILVAGIIVIIGAPGLWFYGRPAYHRHKEARSLEQAKKFMASGDYRNASLSARQTFQLNPRNLDACRIIAELGEKSRSPDVLDWRRRIAALAPTIENKLRLASTELRVQGPPYPLAAQTLEELGDSAKDVAAYHVLCAELALKLNKASEAAAQFEEASRLEPTNELHQLNLAVLRLQSTNASLASGQIAVHQRQPGFGCACYAGAPACQHQCRRSCAALVGGGERTAERLRHRSSLLSAASGGPTFGAG